MAAPNPATPFTTNIVIFVFKTRMEDWCCGRIRYLSRQS